MCLKNLIFKLPKQRLDVKGKQVFFPCLPRANPAWDRGGAEAGGRRQGFRNVSVPILSLPAQEHRITWNKINFFKKSKRTSFRSLKFIELHSCAFQRQRCQMRNETSGTMSLSAAFSSAELNNGGRNGVFILTVEATATPGALLLLPKLTIELS